MTTPTAKSPLSAERVEEFAREIEACTFAELSGINVQQVRPIVQRIAAAGAEAAEVRVRELEQENIGLQAAVDSLQDSVYALSDRSE